MQSNSSLTGVSPLDLVDVLVLAGLSTIGTFGNCLVIVSVIFLRRMRTVTALFVANLAGAGLLLAGLVAPGSSRLLWQRVNTDENYIDGDDLWCQIFGAALFFGCAASVNMSALIAAARYIAVCRPHLSVCLFRHWRVAGWCVAAWIYTVLQVAVPTWTGLFRYTYNPATGVCHLNYTRQPIAIAVYINCVCFTPSTLICAASYALIFWSLRQARRRLAARSDAAAAARRLRRERRATVPMFVALIAFLVHWLPVMITISLDPKFEKFSPALHRHMGLFSIASAFDNWIIYGLLNRHFANAYQTVLCSLCHFWKQRWQLPTEANRRTRRLRRKRQRQRLQAATANQAATRQPSTPACVIEQGDFNEQGDEEPDEDEDATYSGDRLDQINSGFLAALTIELPMVERSADTIKCNQQQHKEAEASL